MQGQSQQHAIAPYVFGVGYLTSLFTCVWVCVTLSGEGDGEEERCLYRLLAANILNYLISFHAKHRYKGPLLRLTIYRSVAILIVTTSINIQASF